MYAPQPPSRPEPTWSRPATTTPAVPPSPPGYLPQAVPPQVVDFRTGRATATWLRIPLDRPIFTRILLAILVVIFIPMALSPEINAQFLAAGGNAHFAVQNGEWWRLITSMFLHGGWLHIALNGYALYIIGTDLEALIGRARFLVIYFVSGVAGSISSFAFAPAGLLYGSVGASGAIFGLIGALGVYFGLHRRLYGRMGNVQFWNIIVVIVLNLGIGIWFADTFHIDNSAHIGGLLAGAALGCVLAPRYALGDWASLFVRNVVNTNKGTLPWLATALVTLIVIFTFFVLLLLFETGVLTPNLVIG